MSEIRKFKIIVDSKELCTCSGSSPSSVAKKAVKKLCDGSKKIVKFSLKECKRDCKKECGPYQGHMEKLDKPYKRKGKTITHRAVCEKVRKMKGGYNIPDAMYFTKNHIIPIAIEFADKNRPRLLPYFPKIMNKKSIKEYQNYVSLYVKELNDELISTTFQFNKYKNEWKNLTDYLKENGYTPGLTVNTYGGAIKGDTIIDFCKNAIILVCTIIHYTKNERYKQVNTNYRPYNFDTGSYINKNNLQKADT